MRDANLIGDVRSAAGADDAPEERAKRAADLIRNSTGYRWVGIYRVTESEIRNLAWRCSGGGGTESGGRGPSVSCSFILSIVAQMPSSETEIMPASSIPCARQNACASMKRQSAHPRRRPSRQPSIG
jgi:hypothetical protein